MNRVAFTLPDVGLREVKGMVYVDEGFLILKVQSAIAGLVDEQKDMIKIEPTALQELSIKRGVFRDRLVIQPKSVELLELVPGDHPSAVELRVWTKYRKDLERLVDEFYDLLI